MRFAKKPDPSKTDDSCVFWHYSGDFVVLLEGLFWAWSPKVFKGSPKGRPKVSQGRPRVLQWPPKGSKRLPHRCSKGHPTWAKGS